MASIKTQPIAGGPPARRGYTEAIVANLGGVGYRVLQNIGQGSAGTIFLARDGQGELVAVKVLQPRLSADAVAVKRFLREASICTRLHHKNLVRSIEAGEHQGTYYLVMEYVPGQTLAQVMERRKRLPEDEAVQIVAQLAEALKVLHDANLVHRDVKPSNVLMTEDGQPKLADLGLAKDLASSDLTRPNQSLGTPIYMAPEQFVTAHTADARCDVYALGIILYSLTTGELPFPGPQLATLLEAKMRGNFIPPETINPQLSAATIQAITRAIQADVEARPKDVGEFLGILLGGNETTRAGTVATVVMEPRSGHADSAPQQSVTSKRVPAPTVAASYEAPSIPELPSKPEIPMVSQAEIVVSATTSPTRPKLPDQPPANAATDLWFLVLSKERELVVVQATAASIHRAIDKGKLQVHICAGRSAKGPFIPLGMIPEFRKKPAQAKA
jgi:serine/threonine protein kinase